MTRKMIGIVIAGATLAVVALFLVLAPIPTRSQEAPSAELERLPDIVPSGPVSQDPNAAPLKQVFLGVTIVEFPDLRDSDEVYSANSAVVTKPVQQKAYFYKDRHEVITWHKFKILENLSGRLVRISSPALPPPEEMLPLNPDEFLIAQGGGTVVIDKIALTSVERDFPPFSLSEKYLLFVVINPDGVAGLAMGPKTVFKMDSKGHLEPVNNEPQPLKDDIAYRLQSSVDELRRDLKNRFPFE